VNHTLVAAERHIADLESRVERQAALIEKHARSGRDTRHAERALRTLEQARDLTRERSRALLSPAYDAAATTSASRPSPAPEGAAEPLAPWETPSMRIAQLAWGEGCSKPGGAEYLLDLVRPLALDSTQRVLEFGAGLGAGGRAVHRTFGVKVAGYEVDASLASAGRQLSVLARLDKAVDIVRYDPRQFTLEAGSYDCVVSTEMLFEIERKEELLGKLEAGLKPRGQLVMTDFVLAPEASADNDRLKALAPGSATFWQADRYARYLRERNFDLRASADITAAYRKLVVDGCKRFTDGGPDYIANARTYPEALFAFLEVWASRVAAFDSGLLKVMRLSAIKLSSPKLMSNW